MQISFNASTAVLLFSLAACGAKDPETGLDETGDSAAPVHTTDLTFLVPGASDATLTLTQIEPAVDGKAVIGSAPFFAGPVDSDTVVLAVPAPDASMFTEVDAFAFPGLLGAMFVPALGSDSSYLGVGTQWPVYLDGEIPKELVSFGAVTGWNIFIFDFSEEQKAGLVLGDIGAILLEENLAPVEEITLGGTYDGSFDVDDLRVTVLPAALVESGKSDWETMADEAMSDNWSITLSGEPPDNHMLADPRTGSPIAIELPSTYVDNNLNESFDPANDAVDAYSCTAASEMVTVLYAELVSDLGYVLDWVLDGGMDFGWNVVRWEGTSGGEPSPGGTPLAMTSDDAANLIIGGDCAF